MAHRTEERDPALGHLRTALEAEERERARIARDLHDQLGQRLSALGVRLAMLKDSPGLDPVTRQAVGALHDLARQADGDLDRVVWRLRPPPLDDHGLEAALRELVEAWASGGPVAATFESEAFAGRRLEPEAETAIYRVAQEALNNVGKHARARAARVRLAVLGGEAVLTVRDDGAGFEVEGTGRSRAATGIAGMRERAVSCDGRLEVRSRPGEGTTVTLRVPFPRTGKG